MARLFLEISFLFCCDVFLGPLDVLFVSLFLPRLKAAATLTDPGGGGGGTVWGIFAATQTTRKTRICQKIKKVLPDIEHKFEVMFGKFSKSNI